MIALVLIGAGVILLGGLLAMAPHRLAAAMHLQAVGAGLIAVAGFVAVTSDGTWGSAFTSELVPHMGIDALTGLFLATLGVVATPALVYASSYLAPTLRGRMTGLLTAAFLLAMVGVLCARDVMTFLILWELMTLIPAGIILVATATRASRRTVFVYLAITHVGSVGVWVALLLLADAGAIGDASAVAQGSGLQAVVGVAAIIGFGTKAGVMPMHTWLPRAHPIAPAHMSALMSGVMVSVAIYGLVRVLVDWLGRPPMWVAVLVLALGLLSAVGGITYALFQHELKGLLAFHTIDNMGIVLLGIGACLLLRAEGADQWAAFALAAALLHAFNHGVFKALLFLGAGAFEKAVGTLRLDRVGGLLRSMPWTAGAFLVGAAAIAGLPPLNGFASEWLILQSLLHVPAYGGAWGGMVGAVALAGLAATAALAVFCFAKVIGLVLLGPPRQRACADAVDPAPPMRSALAFLAVACVVLGLVPGLLFAELVSLAPWAVPGGAPGGPGLNLPATGGLPTVGIAVALFAIVAVLALLRGRRRAAAAPTWACGQELAPSLLWTSAGFTKPLRMVLEVVLRPTRHVAVRTEGGVVQGVRHRSRVPELAEEYLYRPVVRWALACARVARRMQSGHLGAYVAYLIGLVLVLLLSVRIGLIG